MAVSIKKGPIRCGVGPYWFSEEKEFHISSASVPAMPPDPAHHRADIGQAEAFCGEVQHDEGKYRRPEK
jgi:hypothetical protein